MPKTIELRKPLPMGAVGNVFDETRPNGSKFFHELTPKERGRFGAVAIGYADDVTAELKQNLEAAETERDTLREQLERLRGQIAVAKRELTGKLENQLARIDAALAGEPTGDR